MFSLIAYSYLPIFSVPTGVIKFWLASALATSLASSQASCLHRRGVKVELNLALLAAVGKGNGRARHRNEGNTDRVETEVRQPLFRQTFTG